MKQIITIQHTQSIHHTNGIDSWKDQLGQLQSSVDYELVEKDFVSYE